MSATAVKSVSTTNRLQELYYQKAAKELQKELGLANIHQVPRLEKIVVSSGLGRAQDDKKLLEAATNTLRKITGQQPLVTRAKKAVSGFKLREGSKIGLKVTLRGKRMYEFLDRFISVVLPRVRDFHGVSKKSFDRQGNYNIGVSEQSVFPELTFEDTVTVHGIQITFHINTHSNEHSKALLEKFGLPFERGQAKPASEPQPMPEVPKDEPEASREEIKETEQGELDG